MATSQELVFKSKMSKHHGNKITRFNHILAAHCVPTIKYIFVNILTEWNVIVRLMDAYDNPNRTPSNQNDFNRVPNIPSKMANDNDKINHFSLTLFNVSKISKKFQRCRECRTSQNFKINNFKKYIYIIIKIIIIIKE